MSEKKHLNPFSAAFRALVWPDRSFQKEDQFTAPRVVILLFIFIFVLLGALLTTKFNQNPTVKLLTIEETNRRIEKMMAHAPEEVKEQARQSALRSLQGDRLTALMMIGLAVSSFLWMLYILEFWLLFIVLAQFFGGEEQPIGRKKHRKTQYLAIYGIIPLAFQELLRGAVLYFKDPETVENVLTLKEYREVTEVSLSLLSLLSLPRMPAFIDYILYNLSNPFYIWTLFVFLFGGIVVLKITRARMCAVLGVIVALLGLQHMLFSMIGNFFGA